LGQISKFTSFPTPANKRRTFGAAAPKWGHFARKTLVNWGVTPIFFYDMFCKMFPLNGLPGLNFLVCGFGMANA
jgi:hypothetical protein